MRKSETIFYDTVIKMTDIIEKLGNVIVEKDQEINNLKLEIEELKEYIKERDL